MDLYLHLRSAFEEMTRERTVDNALIRRTGLTASQARDEAMCERRLFMWLDTRRLCTFRCRCEIHDTRSVTR